jgi:hypothetical protein
MDAEEMEREGVAGRLIRVEEALWGFPQISEWGIVAVRQWGRYVCFHLALPEYLAVVREECLQLTESGPARSRSRWSPPSPDTVAGTYTLNDPCQGHQLPSFRASATSLVDQCGRAGLD